MTTSLTDIVLAKVDDLIVQATKERSHYYVKSVLEECKSLIKLYDRMLKEQTNKGEI